MEKTNLVRAFTHGPELRAAADGGMPTLVGRFAMFNQWTEIDSAIEGRFMERIAPGAFANTFKNNRADMRVLFQHGRDPSVGAKPLGPIAQLREDNEGAYYEVPLLDTSYNRDLVPGLQAGLFGASFRFNVERDDRLERPKASTYNPNRLPERTITEAKVAEFGPVTFPAYPGATAAVRSMTDEFRGIARRVRPLSGSRATADAQTLATIAQIDLLADQLDELVDTLMDTFGIPDPDEIGEVEEPRSKALKTNAGQAKRFADRKEFIQWMVSRN